MFRILSKDMFLTAQPACSVPTASFQSPKHLDHLRIMLAKDYSFLPEGLSFKWSLGRTTLAIPVSTMPTSTKMHQRHMITCPPLPSGLMVGNLHVKSTESLKFSSLSQLLVKGKNNGFGINYSSFNLGSLFY